ncbi:MAG: hypothetical protein JHD28_01550, partial [Bacteroidia bacterium]|nr:hypothetical protein [Bacteroidia bacterium]
MVLILGVNGVMGQANPGSVFALSTGSWTLTGWSSSAGSGNYPGNGATGSNATTGVVSGTSNANMVFWRHGTTDQGLTTAQSATWGGAYNVSPGIVGNGTNGFSFDNTGGAGYGSAVLSVNTTGRSSIQVAWTGRTIATGARQYGIRLQYRVGTSGSFSDASTTSADILYTGGSAGTSQTMTTVTLPSAAEGQSVVQILWRFYYIGPSTGARPQFGVDDITVSSSSSSVAPLLAITGTTAHGSACVSSSTSAIQYTITNTGTNAATGVSVGSSNSSEFAITTALSSTTIAGNGGTATYSVTFTPSATGARTSTVTVSSGTSGSNSPTSSLTGTGSTTVAAAVTSSAASSLGATTATLNGNVTTLGTCPNTTQKGFVYALTSANAAPANGGSGVTTTSVASLVTGAYTLALTGLTQGVEYSFRAYVFDGSTYTYGSVLTFTTLTPPANDDCSNASTITVNAAATSGNNTLATKSNPTSLTDVAYTTGTARDIWYTFTPTCSGSHTITLTPTGFDGAVALFTGGTCPNPTFTSVADDFGTSVAETITFIATANTTYRILVWGYNSTSGSFTIGVTTPTLTVTTSAASSITTTGATLNGNVTTLCPNITEIGFVYSLTSTNSNPLNAGTGVTKVSVTSVEGAFSTSLSGLTTGSGYSYKAYAFDGTSYTYGSVQTFTPNTAPVTLATYTFTGTACSAAALTASGVGSNYTVANASSTVACNNNGGTTSYSLGGSNWLTTFQSGRYIEVSITPDANYLLTLTNLSFSHLRSSAGATTLNVRSSLDNYATDLTSNITVTTSSNNASIDLTGFTNRSTIVTFRIYGWGGNSTGDLRLDNIAISGNVSAATTLTTSNTTGGALDQIGTQNITRATANVVSRTILTVANGSGTLSSFAFTTPASGSNYTQNDIGDFKFYYSPSANGSTFASASPTLLGTVTSTKNGTGITETINFSGLSQSLAVGTYYLWVTADVKVGALATNTLIVGAPTITASVGSATNGGSAIGTGTQTIIAGAATNVYFKASPSSTSALDPSNWSLNSNGSAGNDFTGAIGDNDINWNIRNSNATQAGTWNLGNNSKVIVGDGTNANSFTINSGVLTGTVDVSNAATLTLNTSTIPTLGALGATSSTVVYSASGPQAVATKNYANLTISGGNTKTISGAAAVSGALVINSSVLALGTNSLTPNTLTLDGLGTKNGSWGSTAGSATYKNATYFGATGTGTITPSNNTAATASFSSIISSQSINYGTATVSLSGVVASGSIFPANGETVSVTINGVEQTTTTTSGNGSFSINYTTSTLPVSAPYTITYAYAGTGNGFLIAANNNTANTLTVNAATNNWIGGTGTWSTPANWSLSRVPSSLNDNITISSGTPTMDAAYTVGSGRTLTLSGTGALIISPSGSLTIAGTVDFGARPVTVQSDNTGTGSIGTITGTLSNASNVTVQRYAAATGRNWRFLSSPVSGVDISNWMSQFYVTGPCTAAPTGGLGSLNDQGWHTSQANITYPGAYNASTNNRAVRTTSIRQYVEANSTSGTASGLNAGWADVTPSTTLNPGQGFRAFIRGPLGTTGQLDGSVTSQTAVTVNLNGTLNQGAINAPTITYTGSGRGWNLIGNPYACAYDWANNATVKTQIVNNTIHVFNPSSNGYISYNPSSGGSLSNGIIPSGAAFFVQATGSGQAAVTFNEAAKVTGISPTVVHKGAKANEFSIKYSKDSTENDVFIAMIIDNATLNNDGYDIIKLRNDNLNLSAYGEDTMQLTLSAIPPIVSETRIKLNVEATVIGTYNFDFKNMDNFQSNITVSLF